MAAAAGDRVDLAADASAAATLAAAEEAWSAAPAAQADLVVAGVRVRARFAGATTTGLLAPLARVAQPAAGTPDATLTLFDAAGSGLRPPPPGGDPGRWSSGGAHLVFEPDAGLLSVLDPVGRRGAAWTEDARELPHWHAAAPLRDLLRWVLRAHGLHYVHAAVVGDARGGVLIAGPAGSGKSTTGMLCATRGLQHLSDDYAVVSVAGDEPVAHALFATAKLDGPSLERLGLPGRAPPGEKLVFAPAAAVVDRLALRAIVLPRVAASTGALVPVSPARALAVVAPSTVIQLAGSRAEDLAALGALARAVPAYRLDVGPDLDAVLARVEEALER